MGRWIQTLCAACTSLAALYRISSDLQGMACLAIYLLLMLLPLLLLMPALQGNSSTLLTSPHQQSASTNTHSQGRVRSGMKYEDHFPTPYLPT
jgi:hypothetical protein